jgi:hypothetical protein
MPSQRRTLNGSTRGSATKHRRQLRDSRSCRRLAASAQRVQRVAGPCRRMGSLSGRPVAVQAAGSWKCQMTSDGQPPAGRAAMQPIEHFAGLPEHQDGPVAGQPADRLALLASVRKRPSQPGPCTPRRTGRSPRASDRGDDLRHLLFLREGGAGTCRDEIWSCLPEAEDRPILACDLLHNELP